MVWLSLYRRALVKDELYNKLSGRNYWEDRKRFDVNGNAHTMDWEALHSIKSLAIASNAFEKVLRGI